MPICALMPTFPSLAPEQTRMLSSHPARPVWRQSLLKDLFSKLSPENSENGIARDGIGEAAGSHTYRRRPPSRTRHRLDADQRKATYRPGSKLERGQGKPRIALSFLPSIQRSLTLGGDEAPDQSRSTSAGLGNQGRSGEGGLQRRQRPGKTVALRRGGGPAALRGLRVPAWDGDSRPRPYSAVSHGCSDGLCRDHPGTGVHGQERLHEPPVP